MQKFISILLRHWSKNPFKISMTIISVALGMGILTLSFTLSSLLEQNLAKELAKRGTILMVSNATRTNTGTIETIRPGQWDFDALATLSSDSSTIEQVSPLATVPFTEVQAAGQSWQLRRVIGVSPAYFSIFALEMLEGTAMLDSDVSTAERKIWLSKSLATTLFGSTAESMGQKIQPPVINFRRGPGSADQSTQTITLLYTVAGVFDDLPEVFRKAYGSADAVLPYTSVMMGGGGQGGAQANNATFMRNMMASTFVAKSRSTKILEAEADIRETLSAGYGNNLSILVWEGSPEGSSDYLKHVRQTMNMFTSSLTILGLMLLLISSLGIFSVMVVESLGRKREIALERAIGASQGLVLYEFWTWSMALSLMGALGGLGLATLLANPIMASIAPLFKEFGHALGGSMHINPLSALFAALLTLAFGGILGLLPGISAVRGTIADIIREA
jgi:putative ABC transport system permease protein